MKLFFLTSIIFIFIQCKNESELIDLNTDYKEGIKLASKEGKKTLLVFDWMGNPTGSSLDLLSNNKVKDALKEFVVIFLYVDKLPKKEFNRKLQSEKYGTDFQPAYYILDENQKIIKGPLGYCRVYEFLNFINLQK